MNSKLFLCLAIVTLKFVTVDSEETDAENGSGENAVDCNPGTYWHTQWQSKSPAPPHEIIIELLPPAVIKGFTYLPRQDESDHGTIKDYEFYVSDDGRNFGQPVKKGTFEPGRGRKIETFEPIKCRFIKLRAISEINGLPWTSAAEIGVIQSGEDGAVENAVAGEPSIALSVAIPAHNGERSVDDHDRNPHFHVIVSNISDTSSPLTPSLSPGEREIRNPACRKSDASGIVPARERAPSP